MKARRAFRVLPALAFAGVFLWIAAVTASRAVALASGRTPLGAVGESRFLRWAYRDGPLVGRLEAAGRGLAPGQAVLPVCAPTCDTSWFRAMAVYGLPGQVVVDARTEGQVGRVFPTRVERSIDGIRLLPRSDAEVSVGGR